MLLYEQTRQITIVELKEVLTKKDALLNELREQLGKAQVYMKQMVDQNRIEVEFQMEDRVYLYIKPYRMHSLAKKMNEKLSLRYFGPYEIDQRIRKVAYKLNVPPTANIHLVFHVSQLKKVIGDAITVQPLAPILIEVY